VPPDWQLITDDLAVLRAAASLLAYLLHRGSLAPAAVSAVTLAHVLALFCAMPAPMELIMGIQIKLLERDRE
jgi:hypothetical protein